MGENVKTEIQESALQFGENSFDVLRLISALLIVLGHIVTHLDCEVLKPVLIVQQK